MQQVISSAQMRAIEHAAITSGQLTGLALMERAAQGAVAAMLAEWPELDVTREPVTDPGGGAAPAPPRYFGQDEGTPQALVLCGPGNNGGDGFAMARILQGLGWSVRVMFFGTEASLPADARNMWRQWRAIGAVPDWTTGTAARIAAHLSPGRPLVVVDALFGIGLSRPLGAEVTGVWRAFCKAAAPLMAPGARYLCAVDTPSGRSDNCPEAPRLDWFDDPALPRLTVTFHAAKTAHRAMIAAAERLRVVDIGLDGWQGDA
ncbi:NAD(P)H-hydrate epimerase [Szabonella alba]|uniref:NAD(P)H-hydrate epimerase n=1 Tax=Szabonella alba TaxID=2804194 RepID=A0A8K0V8T6_9RHOB|nr:NAD(P)H-hydrate epimerase [Szabonella alba]